MTNKTIDEVYSQLANIVSTSYTKMANNVLIRSGDNIILFNKYAIKKTSNGYIVKSRMTFTEAEFGSIKNAFVWAILDHNRKFNESERVVEIDAKLSSVDVELTVHKKLKISGNLERAGILSSKIQQGNERRAEYIKELNRYSAMATSLSVKDFKIS